MAPLSTQLARSRVRAGLAWLGGTLTALLVTMVPTSAHAGEPVRELRWSLGSEPVNMLRLQPEHARLMLSLPPEWMPKPDLGQFGIEFDPRKHWRMFSAKQLTAASIGPSFRLLVETRAQSVRFGLNVMPRRAVLVVHFDPLPQHLR